MWRVFFLPGSAWADAARKNLPPSVAAGRAMNPKRLPGIERIASLLEQLTESEHLPWLVLDEVAPLKEAEQVMMS